MIQRSGTVDDMAHNDGSTVPDAPDTPVDADTDADAGTPTEGDNALAGDDFTAAMHDGEGEADDRNGATDGDAASEE
jgi:hypothetical protein